MIEEKKEQVLKELVRAKKSLSASKKLLEAELLEDSISRSYYAVLHAAKAILISEGIEVNSHNAVVKMFGLHIVKTGKMDKEFAKILIAEQEDREISDYDIDIEIEKDRAVQRTEEAEKFVKCVEFYFLK